MQGAQSKQGLERCHRGAAPVEAEGAKPWVHFLTSHYIHWGLWSQPDRQNLCTGLIYPWVRCMT
jgi:hypothetical protein